VASYTDPKANPLDYRPWYVRRGSRWERAEVVSVRPHGDGFVAELAGVADRDAALGYRGADIAVESDVLPPADENEFYWKDLIGLSVQDAEGNPLGVVVRLLETGRHDVLVVENEAGEMLIPFVDRYVIDVELDKGFLTADWQEDY
jgi:16S rRNA processing protein RimM